MSSEITPTVLQILEKNLGKNVRIVVDRNFGYEGELVAISQNPPGIWLSKAEAIVLRTTLAHPLPQVISREEMSEIFINLNASERIVILHQS